MSHNSRSYTHARASEINNRGMKGSGGAPTRKKYGASQVISHLCRSEKKKRGGGRRNSI